MRHVFTALLLPLFVLSVGLLAAAEGDKVKAKKSPIEGSWSGEKDGAKATLKFVGDKFTLTKSFGDKSFDATGTFKLDTKASPNTIDMLVTGGTLPGIEKFKDKIALGIVKVDGNKLEWCANEPGKDGRPKAFADTDGGAKYLYMKLERDKK